jgi:hypothetical protein
MHIFALMVIPQGTLDEPNPAGTPEPLSGVTLMDSFAPKYLETQRSAGLPKRCDSFGKFTF